LAAFYADLEGNQPASINDLTGGLDRLHSLVADLLPAAEE
jgi:hypothetical protein